MTTLKKAIAPLLLISSLIFVSCSSTPKKENISDASDGLIDEAAQSFPLELNGSSDDNSAGPLQTIYFGFNSSELSMATRGTLEQNAMWLKGADKVDIQIEGHADERGGHQFNLALGERRAKAVKEYLEALGVNSARISVISYGKEKPVSYGHDEDSWSKNRRANFVITAK